MSVILVTGGAGFIGSNFVRYMVNKYPQYKIINLDKLTYSGNLENLKDVEDAPNYSFVKGCITDGKLIQKLIEKYECDYIVNFAAESVAEEEFVTVHWNGEIQVLSMKKLFERLKESNKVIWDGKHEIIDTSNEKIKVLSFYNNSGTFLPLRKIIRHPYRGKILKLKQKQGEVLVTPNHSVYNTHGKVVAAKSNPSLLYVRDMNFSCRDKKIKHPKILGMFNDKKLKFLCRLLAAYISSGYLKQNYVIINDNDKSWLEILSDDFKNIFDGNSLITENNGTLQLKLKNKDFYKICTKFCNDGDSKKIPNFVFNIGKEYQEIFWKSLVKGINNGKEEFLTSSRRLAAEVCLLLLLIGKEFYVDYKMNAYNIKVGNCKFKSKKITEKKYEGFVYDLEVEGSHNFVAGVGNIVVHNTHVDRSIMEPGRFVKTNVLGTQVLLESARKYGIEKFIQISTDEVYGTLGDEGYFTEDSPLKPNSPYAASKAGADLLVRSYHKTYGLPVNIVRPSNNYGPYQFPEKFIPLMITNALENKPLPIYGDGSNIRDWLYVKDTCKAIDLILHKGKNGEIYNVSANNEKRNIEVVKLILKKLNKPQSLIKFVKDRPAHDYRYALDSSKIKNELGWKPEYSFEEGLEKTIKWYIENKEWWKRIKTGEYMEYYKKWYGKRLNLD
ncbi:NAD-dependent epimerase/dehydratase [Methanothermus fervidus DSM 2088]|uniref:NAD-dependent epimerase/dehydratase n=1 Tax=Methanothermus fervidus (strain ATCC 43054 / DSM 2088 / JCM 10308 / V24 S) TaxID=523846 RepID=E3GXQ1_METFV|nr:dTDP-glucose 4,6-dehydratase [Methanothermus fervidus]ADP77083.1 NAD-dependent epimerase/dehydratase [Methanothermus fervidus DSM 2088]